MNRVALLIFVAVAVAGCAPVAEPPPDAVGPACVGLAFATLEQVTPSPAPRKCCGECGGTGKVRSGDGIALISCGCDAACKCQKPKQPAAPAAAAPAAPAAKPSCPTGKCQTK